LPQLVGPAITNNNGCRDPDEDSYARFLLFAVAASAINYSLWLGKFHE
jgi:hypothetical protein